MTMMIHRPCARLVLYSFSTAVTSGCRHVPPYRDDNDETRLGSIRYTDRSVAVPEYVRDLWFMHGLHNNDEDHEDLI